LPDAMGTLAGRALAAFHELGAAHMTPFAQFIKEAREDAGMSLAEAAEAIGCTKSYLWDMEQGRATNPTITILVGLAKALDLYLDDLAMTAAVSLHPRT